VLGTEELAVSDFQEFKLSNSSGVVNIHRPIKSHHLR